VKIQDSDRIGCVITLSLPNADATHSLGLNLGRSLPEGRIILLEGNLGSGKTTLVQGLGQGLGITEAIVSPTFTLIHEYSEGRIPLYHLDLYRLQPAEVSALYLETYWEGVELPLGIVAIEWPERLPYWPADYLRVRLSDQGELGRQVEMIPAGKFDLSGLALEK
jgi:tRNA threonylcarbamoyladenosine biosynthesis protein TsaE